MAKLMSAHGGQKIPVRSPEMTVSDWISALLSYAPSYWFQRKLDEIDAGLARGSLEATLPDGSFRLLGARGEGPRAAVHLHDWEGLIRLGLNGSVGWYRAWEDGLWTSEDLVSLFHLFMRNSRHLGDSARAKGVGRWIGRLKHERKRNDRRGSRTNIHAHYDIGNDFYKLWLDKNWNYSSALFEGDDISLEEAQLAKNDAILDRLKLHRGSHLLEIGCGWGGLAERALQRFDIDYTGITLSSEQKQFIDLRLRALNGAETHRILLSDYRDITGQFDAIASVEMVEAVGLEYWDEYVNIIAQLLRKNGRAAIQFISMKDDIFDAYSVNSDFIQTYIFPGGCLISEQRFSALCDQAGLEWQDQRSFGLDYAKTLKIWRSRFDRAAMEQALPACMDQRFINLWRYYLQYCEGGFRSGGITVSQITLVKK